jgi:hypothetical protein
MGLGYSTTPRLLTPASSRLKPVPQKHRIQSAKLVSPTRDAERPGMHTHAKRGHDRARSAFSSSAWALWDRLQPGSF